MTVNSRHLTLDFYIENTDDTDNKVACFKKENKGAGICNLYSNKPDISNNNMSFMRY